MIDILQETMRLNNIAVSCKVILESRKKLCVCVEASLPSLCETFVIFAGGGFPESSPIAKQFHSHRTDTSSDQSHCKIQMYLFGRDVKVCQKPGPLTPK